MGKKLLMWWNNLPFCRRKKQQWLEKHAASKGLLNEIKWPETVFHQNKKEFVESDWVYSKGDRCERYVAWFFKWITERCTVEERVMDWVPMDVPTGCGGGHPEGWITAYKVKDDDGDVHNAVKQADLSY